MRRAKPEEWRDRLRHPGRRHHQRMAALICALYAGIAIETIHRGCGATPAPDGLASEAGVKRGREEGTEPLGGFGIRLSSGVGIAPERTTSKLQAHSGLGPLAK